MSFLKRKNSTTVFFLVLLFWDFFVCCNARVFTFTMHHRFSDPVKKWSESVAGKPPPPPPPEKDSVEYYAELANRDRLLRGRKLYGHDDATSSASSLAFSDGNSTLQISSLGYLHYTTVQLGTPGVKFMVALDTGSDLFWVPCDCTRCAATNSAAFASDFDLSVYNPNGSSTGKKVPCSNSLCIHRNQCLRPFSDCPYSVSYVSAETSTSGILVEDVLHLTKEDHHNEPVKAHVIFGCGQVQSGSFLDVAAPNGLLGLGMERVSVPSILSREGLTANSFSMCFGRDGIGRISFGDKGSPDQGETPFNLNPFHPTYNITVTQVRLGKTLIDAEFTALFDSGTSFTYLVDPIYTRLSKSFHSQIRDRRRLTDSKIPFEFCYDMSSDINANFTPTMGLTMKGGSHFAVYDPIIPISAQNVYCLAVVKSTGLNIIGQNFMKGYQVVFDREKFVLGWKKSDCDDIEDEVPFEAQANKVPPAVAVGLGNHTVPKSTTKTLTNSHGSRALSTSHYSRTSLLSSFVFLSFFFWSHIP